jgi:calcineurin-like phosphoesterase family protein
MKTFVTADWHLGEERFELMGRPFKTQMEMVETLIERHNSVVAPHDHVIIIGDVVNQQTPEFLKYVAQFHGTKTLIRGNHDREIPIMELLKYFNMIVPEGSGLKEDMEGIPCYLTHYPSCGRPDRFNIVGHIHSAWKVQLNMFNAGVDVNHFYPVDIKKIPFYYKAITEFYDEDVWVAYNEVNQNFREVRGKKSNYFKRGDC